MVSDHSISKFIQETPSVGYKALRQSLAWADLGQRVAILAHGSDAVRFIDNFTTAALAKLVQGQGTEGFFTDSRGWVLALTNILRLDGTSDGLMRGAELWIDAPLGMATCLREHLEHYHIRERVELIDVSMDRVSILVAGPQASDWLASHCNQRLPTGLLDHHRCMLGDIFIQIVRVDWVGPNGFLLHAAQADRQQLIEWLTAQGVVEATNDDVCTARIEAGLPVPVDIPEKTLPQELCRDQHAISFTKGCYLGQETVARIDAMGHVNRQWVAVAIDGMRHPPADMLVTKAGVVVGRITSACLSPLLGSTLGLGLFQTKGLANGGSLQVEGFPARIVEVPLPTVGSAFTDQIAASIESPEQVLLETKRFRVVRVSEACRDGTLREREVVQHPGCVVIVPLLSPESICLVEVVRAAVGRTLLELPAGTLDRVESLEAAARRELAEETGYRAGQMTPAGEFWMSPGILRERMHLFVAEDLVAGSQALEPGEQIRTRVVSTNEAIAMCLDGRIEDAKTIIGLLLLAKRTQRAMQDDDQ